MANIKSIQGQFDEDYYRYLNNAITYGPYMQEVNLQIAQLLLLYGADMPDFSKQVAFEQINRTLLGINVRLPLLQFAKSINKEQLVCTIGMLNKIDWISDQRLCK